MAATRLSEAFNRAVRCRAASQRLFSPVLGTCSQNTRTDRRAPRWVLVQWPAARMAGSIRPAPASGHSSHLIEKHTRARALGDPLESVGGTP